MQGSAIALYEAAADLEASEASIRTGEAHVELRRKFVAGACGEAVDLADEYCWQGTQEFEDEYVEVEQVVGVGDVEGRRGGD